MIFHLPYKPDSNKASASQIRPYKMIGAFRELGYNVVLIMGTAHERKEEIGLIKKRIMAGDVFDFIYSESSTMPTLLTESHHLPLYPTMDFGFLRFCKRKGIPIGLFYRDIHWKFDHYELGKYSIKRVISYLFYKLDLKLYTKYLDIVYLPSLETRKYIPELDGMRVEPLPPGNDNVSHSGGNARQKKGKIHFLYIGGMGELYNLKLFLKVLGSFSPEKFTGTVCTREQDYLKVQQEYEAYFSADNINLVHLKGEELIGLYEEADICCLFVNPTAYWEFVVPFKLFEYIASKRPLLAVEGTAVGTFVAKNNIGWSVKYTESDLKSFFQHVEEEFDEPTRSEMQINLDHLAKTSTWKARAEFVAKSLLD